MMSFWIHRSAPAVFMKASSADLEARVWSLLNSKVGTRSSVRSSGKWNRSPLRTTGRCLTNLTNNAWCPGVCPGVDLITTVPSPNTSRSPSSTFVLERLIGIEGTWSLFAEHEIALRLLHQPRRTRVVEYFVSCVSCFRVFRGDTDHTSS